MGRSEPLVTGHRPVIVLIALTLATLMALAAVPAKGASETPSVKVMSRNLYLGADLMPVVAAPDIPTLMANAATVVKTVHATDFPTRAKALAKEIDEQDPWLVGLQEVSLWRRGASGVLDGPVTPAKKVVYDFLTSLMQQLDARGLRYEVVVEQSNFDAEVPTALNYDIRLTQRNVILARTDLPASKLRTTKPRAGHYQDNSTFPTSFGSLTDTRGWVSIDAAVAGEKFRFINTHLDSYFPATRKAQVAELLAGLAGTSKPVVLVGDLNAQPQSDVVGMVTAAGLRDAWALAGSGSGYTCCQLERLQNKTSKLDRRIDYVFVETGVRLRKAKLVGDQRNDRTGGLWPSDHAGVVATLTP